MDALRYAITYAQAGAAGANRTKLGLKWFT